MGCGVVGGAVDGDIVDTWVVVGVAADVEGCGVVGGAVDGGMVVGGACVVVTGWKQALMTSLVFTGLVPFSFFGVIVISTLEPKVPGGKTNGLAGSST